MLEVKPSVAAAAGLAVRDRELPMRLVLADGRTIAVPLAAPPAIRLGDATIADLDVGVYDVMPDEPELAGLLGEDALGFFTVTLDRETSAVRLSARSSGADGRQRP
jgi:hypothetical protein